MNGILRNAGTAKWNASQKQQGAPDEQVLVLGNVAGGRKGRLAVNECVYITKTAPVASTTNSCPRGNGSPKVSHRILGHTLGTRRISSASQLLESLL